MDRERFAYTSGLAESELRELLAQRGHGVLSLARGDDAYAVPVAYFYDGDAGVVYFRLGMTDDSTKQAFVDSTATATLVVYDVEPTADARELDSWSVLVRGPLRPAQERELAAFDTEAVNRRFSPIRVFDEPIDDVEVTLLALEIDSLTGRKTTE
jgi:nitroimidazol reductase NimA-like FMN-containing flavoprotein (pyridoxamine 5'-phosphate oxidase superfamily)